jgi:hypothetical protein
VTDARDLSAAEVIRTDDQRWTLAPGGQDVQPRLGLGHSQQRADRAAVTPRPLVGCASARLPHLRLERTGAPGQRTPDQTASLSTAAAQDQRRHLRWEDRSPDLKAECPRPSVLQALERLRVA